MKKFNLLLMFTVFLFVQVGNISAQENWSLKWSNNSINFYWPEHSPDNKTLVVESGPQPYIHLYDVETGNLIWELQSSGNTNFSPDGSLISIYYYSSNSVDLLNANTGKVFKTFPLGYMNQFTSDSKYLIIASANQVYKIGISGTPFVWQFPVESPIDFIKLSHDSKKLATYSEDGSIHVWNAQNGTLIWEKTSVFSSLTNLVFSPDDTRLLGYLESERKIDLWNSNSGYLYWELDPYSVNNSENLNKNTETNGNYDNKAGYVHFIKNGSMIVFNHGNSISAASVDDASIIWSITCPTWSTVVDKNGDRIAASASEKILYIIDANDGSFLLKSEQASDLYSILNFSPDGKTLACVQGDGALELWTRERLITVNSINNGEILHYPQQTSISWTSQNVSNVKIEYSTDNKVSWQLVADSIAASEGSYLWNIPNENIEQCWVRVSDCDSSHIYSTNDSAFEIVMQPVTVTYPNDDECIYGSSAQNITWSRDTVSEISLFFSHDNGNTWDLLASGIDASLGSYEWSVPNSYSEECRIKISSTADSTIYDVSDSAFSICKDLVLTSPLGGDNWEINTVRTITWTSVSSDSIAIEISTDNGLTWISISEGIPASEESYNYLVPDTPSSECMIRISDLKNQLLVVTGETFNIIPQKITLIHPNGGEIWNGDEIHEIQWVAELTDNVRIEYSVDEGESWTNIISNISADAGSFLWSVPDIYSESCRIRISNAENQWSYDESDSLFTIEQSVGIEDEKIPTQYALLQNYPNPFNPTTVISYDLPENAFVNLKIFDITGKEVAEIVNSEKSAGKHRIQFDANKLSSGIYFYQIKTNQYSETKKMILIR